MLKTRILPTLLFKETTLVKGVRFDSWRRTGSLMQAIKVYEMRGVDELVFLDISATSEGRSPDFQLIEDFAQECFMPLSIGGGIRTLEDVRTLLRVGADKVVINTAFFENPKLISQVSERFGAQCVIGSLDCKKDVSGSYQVYSHCGTKPTGKSPFQCARDLENLGAGEILLTSIDRDGTFEGYDLDLTREIVDSVTIPVIASGGAGSYQHMADVLLEGKASAVAASSIFQFTEMTPKEAKIFLREKGIPTRI